MNFNQTNNNQGDVINHEINPYIPSKRLDLISKRNVIMAAIEIAKSGEFGWCDWDMIESELSPILTAIKVQIAASENNLKGSNND